jgi:hypothetical protein
MRDSNTISQTVEICPHPVHLGHLFFESGSRNFEFNEQYNEDEGDNAYRDVKI